LTSSKRPQSSSCSAIVRVRHANGNPPLARPFEESAPQACRTALSETTTYSPSESEAASAMRADALRAEAWAGEPFLRTEEDPEAVLAPGTARRRALEDALAEIAAGLKEPSSEWQVRYALMLGL